jgi:hypothetical protein
MNSERYVEDFLYDNEADPYQQRNLVCEPEYAGIRQELQGKLLAELAAVGEPPAEIEAPTNQPDDLHITGAAQ